MTQEIGVGEQRRRVTAIIATWPVNQKITLTGDTTSGSAAVANPSSIAGLVPGMAVAGAGVPAATTILAVDSAGGGTITLSHNATATAAGVTLTVTSGTSSAQVHLFKAPFAGGVDPTPGDFSEADFDTYAAQAVTTGQGPYLNPDGSAEVIFGDFGWVLFALPVVGNQIYGYWVDYLYPVGGATRVVALWESFSQPKNMNADGNAVVFSFPVLLPGPGAALVA